MGREGVWVGSASMTAPSTARSCIPVGEVPQHRDRDGRLAGLGRDEDQVDLDPSLVGFAFHEQLAGDRLLTVLRRRVAGTRMT